MGIGVKQLVDQPGKQVLELHKDVPHKALTSVAIQLRFNHIDLNSYKARMKLPGFRQPNSHRCTCIGSAEQTPEHILMECPELAPLRKTAKELGFGGTIKEVLKNATFLVQAAKIMLQSGRLKQIQHVNPYLYAF
ncbi:hypothetical protein XPA_000970 [Xanthoria parietina]